MSVKKAQREIDSAEFTYWMAYYGIEPWGDDWLQTGLIVSKIHNCVPGRKRTQMLKPSDVIPITYKRMERQTSDEIRGVMMQFASAHNRVIELKRQRRG